MDRNHNVIVELKNLWDNELARIRNETDDETDHRLAVRFAASYMIRPPLMI